MTVLPAPPPSIVIESGPFSLCSDTIISAAGKAISSSTSEAAAIHAGPSASLPHSVLSLTAQQGALGAAIISRERPHLLHLLRPKMDRVGFPTVEDCTTIGLLIIRSFTRLFRQ